MMTPRQQNVLLLLAILGPSLALVVVGAFMGTGTSFSEGSQGPIIFGIAFVLVCGVLILGRE